MLPKPAVVEATLHLREAASAQRFAHHYIERRRRLIISALPRSNFTTGFIVIAEGVGRGGTSMLDLRRARRYTKSRR